MKVDKLTNTYKTHITKMPEKSEYGLLQKNEKLQQIDHKKPKKKDISDKLSLFDQNKNNTFNLKSDREFTSEFRQKYGKL